MTALSRTSIAAIGLAVSLGVSRAAGAGPVNLVDNGDFSAGLVGFGSDYADTPSTGWNPATYTVTSDPGLWHPAFVDIGDHTTGTGLMFVGNGSTTLGSTVWRSESISVASGQEYYFEAFVNNVCCDNFLRTNGQSILDFTVAFNGGPAFSLGTRATDIQRPGVWQGLSTDWIAPTSGTVVLSLANLTPDYDANDFAIDDVYFGNETSLPPVPEPATLALLLGGLPIARAAYKRRAARRQAACAARGRVNA